VPVPVRRWKHPCSDTSIILASGPVVVALAGVCVCVCVVCVCVVCVCVCVCVVCVCVVCVCCVCVLCVCVCVCCVCVLCVWINMCTWTAPDPKNLSSFPYEQHSIRVPPCLLPLNTPLRACSLYMSLYKHTYKIPRSHQPFE